jgi:type 1 glutamine amidotransferase
MEHGGAWLGFHFAGYNDESTRWPWFAGNFLDAVFLTNNWPPLPATLIVEDRSHPVTRGLPETYISPANEWYVWKPDPRASKDIHVLASLSPSNYPIGMKDTIAAGDLPVVWTNTRYKMVYCNMGHGDKIFTSATQNQLFKNAVLWLRESAAK